METKDAITWRIQIEFELSLPLYSTLKSDQNDIGQYGVRQLSQCYWINLNRLTLGTKRIIEITIKLEKQPASGE